MTWSNLSGRHNWRLVLVAALVAATIASVPQASAATTWRAFGSGFAVNRGGGYFAPDIDIESVTEAHPDEVRFVVHNRAGANRRIQIYWDLYCWRPGTYGDVTVTSKSADFAATVGPNQKLVRTPSFGSSAKYCDLSVWTTYTGGSWDDPGRMDLRLEARY